MPGIVRINEDGESYRWIPEPPEGTVPARIKVGETWCSPWQRFKELREQYQWHSPIRCISCGHPVLFFDAFNISRVGRRGRVDTVAEGSIKVGARIRHLAVSTNPAMAGKMHAGKPLHIMHWMVYMQGMKGPGCKECQGHMVRHTEIDLTQELLRSIAA